MDVNKEKRDKTIGDTFKDKTGSIGKSQAPGIDKCQTQPCRASPPCETINIHLFHGFSYILHINE